jgi:hypothetical protein
MKAILSGLGAVFLLMAGCGSDAASSPDGSSLDGHLEGDGPAGDGMMTDGGLTPAQAFLATFEAQCEGFVACLAMPDVATCLAGEDVSGPARLVSDSVRLGKIRFDPNQAAICHATQLTVFAECSTLPYDPRIEADCRGVFTGLVAIGGACVWNGECAPGSACDRSACADTDLCCAGTCVALPGLGDPCTGDDCPAGSSCDINSICSPLTANGQSCDLSGDCASAFCRVTDSTCAPLPGEGSSCGASVEGNTPCARSDDLCDTNLICSKRLTVGMPCDPSNDACVGYAACDSTSHCAARLGLGAPCALDSDCLSANCQAYLCAQQPTTPVCAR